MSQSRGTLTDLPHTLYQGVFAIILVKLYPKSWYIGASYNVRSTWTRNFKSCVSRDFECTTTSGTMRHALTSWGEKNPIQLTVLTLSGTWGISGQLWMIVGANSQLLHKSHLISLKMKTFSWNTLRLKPSFYRSLWRSLNFSILAYWRLSCAMPSCTLSCTFYRNS